MTLLGAHMSIAGGLPTAIERATATGCQALQIFTKSVGRWRARPLAPEEVREFRRRVRESELAAVVAHASYLINLASVNPALRQRSTEALGEELERAESLGLDALVVHPGSHTTGEVDECLTLVSDAVRTILASQRRGRTRLLLENTAGQGTNLGHRFEQLGTILHRVGRTRRVGVCLDTCHLVAAGYELASPEGYRRTFDQFDATVGIDRLGALHLNDSKRPRGSRVDRHEHIGDGYVGLAGFRRLVNDGRFDALPMILETPKMAGRQHRASGITADPCDMKNLDVLRRLARPRRKGQ